jgi:2-phospho-L-lactate guanylyltransferase
MTVYAVVPVKKLGVTKRRLSRVLTPQQRQQLTLAMLQDVLTAINCSKVDTSVVVGEDDAVGEMAKKFGSSYLSANGADLNGAIENAQDWCLQNGASAVLVLPADLPLLEVEDINRILELGAGDSAVVLSPSRDWGTNALYQTPPKQIPACFGPQSFMRHIKEAYQRGISVRLHFSHSLAADVDCARDLKKVFHSKQKTVTKQVLEQIKLAGKNSLTSSPVNAAEQKIKN